jgi:two-component system, chemotaxis family, protein-glutamate methylesterase/glutaminase
MSNGRKPDEKTVRTKIAADITNQEEGRRAGEPSVFSCPDCGGVLWQVSATDFECHTEHAWKADALLVEKTYAVEHALHEAVRLLREKSILLRQLAVTVRHSSAGAIGDLIEQADQNDEHARLIRSRLLLDNTQINPDPDIAQAVAEVVEEFKRQADG